MLFLRACPHCGGDLATGQDRICGYIECVQCGHVLSRTQERALGVRITRRGTLMRWYPTAESAASSCLSVYGSAAARPVPRLAHRP